MWHYVRVKSLSRDVWCATKAFIGITYTNHLQGFIPCEISLYMLYFLKLHAELETLFGTGVA